MLPRPTPLCLLLLFPSRPAALATATATATATASPIFSWLASNGGGASVAVGTSPDGLRGLVATSAAQAGDVLLEVPLACCLSDFGAGEAAIEPPGCTKGMEWTVQLACSVLAHQLDDSPVLQGWPEPPPVPLLGSDDELALACDDALAARVREQRLWAVGQCALALDAAEAAGDDTLAAALRARDGAPFIEALALVSSRALLLKASREVGITYLKPSLPPSPPSPPAPSACLLSTPLTLRCPTEQVGMRRLLVPCLDLANHAERPSALYAFSPSR
jgi:hypothetical protein